MSDNSAVHRDAFHLLCGDRLGYGMSRSVFACTLHRNCVVKVEEGAGQFQNVVEWETWRRVEGTPFAKWFAPCMWISPNGSVLIMARTTPAPEYPERMPAFLSDFKRTNYGMHEGRLVCHDYGTHLMFEHGMTKRLIKADWWDA